MYVLCALPTQICTGSMSDESVCRGRGQSVVHRVAPSTGAYARLGVDEGAQLDAHNLGEPRTCCRYVGDSDIKLYREYEGPEV